MSFFPAFINPGLISEAMGLGKRAVAALERQAELMADPEPEEKAVPPEGSEVIGEGPGKYYKESVVADIQLSAIKLGRKQVIEELENILDAGHATVLRAVELRKLVEKHKPKEESKYTKLEDKK